MARVSQVRTRGAGSAVVVVAGRVPEPAEGSESGPILPEDASRRASSRASAWQLFGRGRVQNEPAILRERSTLTELHSAPSPEQ